MRLLLVLLSLTGVLAIVGSPTASAQGATPISVPSPATAGCDQIGAYVEARQKIMDELLADIAGVFPDVATPITEHGAELGAAMLAMTPEQTGKLAEAYRAAADKIEKLDVPEIAAFYNDQIVVLYRTSGQAFEEAKTSDLMTAGEKYGDQLGAVANAIFTYGNAAVAICPGFADVLTVDQTQVGA
ncbi:MAG: hypothetical protein QM758_27850 [Armatimonas sp.]